MGQAVRSLPEEVWMKPFASKRSRAGRTPLEWKALTTLVSLACLSLAVPAFATRDELVTPDQARDSRRAITAQLQADEVTVSGVTRIMHPAYRSGNQWFSNRDPWNRDYTRMLMFESSFTHPVYGTTGRGLVWGFVAELKQLGAQFQRRAGEAQVAYQARMSQLLRQYEQAARPIDANYAWNRWPATSAYWSPFPGEENILYAINLQEKVLARLDVDTGGVTVVASYDPGDGTVLSEARSNGWTFDDPATAAFDPRFHLSFQGEWYSAGYLIDVHSGAKEYFPRSPGPLNSNEETGVCSDDRRYFPYTTHGHGDRSPDGSKFTNNYGFNSTKGVYICQGDQQTFVHDRSYVDRIEPPWPKATAYVSWKASERWFLVSGDQEIMDGSQPWYYSAPAISEWPMWQVFFDGQSYRYRELLAVRTAARWDVDGDPRNGNEGRNWHAHLIPVLRSDGRQIWYTATDAEYSYEDWEARGVTPWGFEGTFLADLSPASGEGTFSDVPASHWAFSYIEALYQGSFLAGCQETPDRSYCPQDGLTRAEAAVFVERGLHGGGFLPEPPAAPVFADVALVDWYAKWADALWQEGYTAGCGTAPLLYCPLQIHSRAEAAVFFVRLLRGAEYQPQEPITLYYEDVGLGTWYAKWVAAADQDGLTRECEDPANRADRRFRPEEPISRAEAACMLARAKAEEAP